ncbi:MAG: glucose-6-phosphate isomerase, partial [Phycisphaerae bacterium]
MSAESTFFLANKNTTPLTERSAFTALAAHFEKASGLQLRDLFTTDPQRAEKFSLEAAGLFLDYSKNRITEETVALLLALARESGLPEHIAAMFAGEKINITENRSVLH